jgi:hypothetical protein
VVRRTLIVFLVSLVVFILLAMGMGSAEEFPDENIIWTPEGNPSLVNKGKAEELFPQKEKYRVINLMVEATGDNVLTRESLETVREFEELMGTIWEYSDTTLDATNKIVRPGKGTKIYWKDICRYTEHTFGTGTATETVQQCDNFGLLQFVYTKQADYLDKDGGLGYPANMPSDSELVTKIRTGKGDTSLFGANDFVYLPALMGGIVPSDRDEFI